MIMCLTRGLRGPSYTRPGPVGLNFSEIAMDRAGPGPARTRTGRAGKKSGPVQTCMPYTLLIHPINVTHKIFPVIIKI